MRDESGDVAKEIVQAQFDLGGFDGVLRCIQAADEFAEASKRRNFVRYCNSSQLCNSAVIYLTELDPEKAFPIFIGLASSPIAHIRAAVALALGAMKDARAVEQLVLGLKDHDQDVRYRSVYALGNFSGNPSIVALIGCLQDETELVRHAAISVLGRLRDSRAVEPLIACLNNESDRNEAPWSLGNIGDIRAVEPLINCLNDPDLINETDFRVKRFIKNTISALGQLGDSRAVEPLIARLNRENDREEAARSLGHIGDIRAVEPLINCLNDPDIGLSARSTIVAVVGQLGDSRAVEPLIKCLTETDPSELYFRCCVIKALGNIGDSRAVVSLKACLDDEKYQEEVEQALAKLATP